MQDSFAPSEAFVIKVEDLHTLNYLAADHPKPQSVEWINRGTDQKLRPSSVEMLKRTLFQDIASPSVVKLLRSAGLRVIFSTSREREAFVVAFAAARKQESLTERHLVTAIFDAHQQAEIAIEALVESGIPREAISLLRRASQFIDADTKEPAGHSKLSIAGATAGGGVAGAVLGVAMLMIPGVGPIAAAGAIAASAISSVGAVSGIIGATGGAIARMLTDHDVDGVSAGYYEQQILRGKVFVSVDIYGVENQRDTIKEILIKNGGRTSTRR